MGRLGRQEGVSDVSMVGIAAGGDTANAVTGLATEHRTRRQHQRQHQHQRRHGREHQARSHLLVRGLRRARLALSPTDHLIEVGLFHLTLLRAQEQSLLRDRSLLRANSRRFVLPRRARLREPGGRLDCRFLPRALRGLGRLRLRPLSPLARRAVRSRGGGWHERVDSTGGRVRGARESEGGAHAGGRHEQGAPRGPA